MRTVLVRPSNSRGSLYLTKMGFLPVPVGLLQLAASIRTVAGNQVFIIDMEADKLTMEETVARTLSLKPDLVGITIHATASYNSARQLMLRLKEEKHDLKVIVGGHHATFLPESIIRDGFDIVALGEGDETIRELVSVLESGASSVNVRGIVFRDGDRIIRTAPRPLISDLDSLPLPSLDLVDREKYQIRTFGTNETVVCLETSRGCPYACDFCSVTPTWGYRRRYKSNARIIAEMEMAKRAGYDWIFFTDDIFILPQNLDQRRKLFSSIADSGPDIRWLAQMRADVIARNPDIIPAAVMAGFRVAAIGVESGSREVLKKMRKSIRASDTVAAIRALDENGVVVLLSFMIGAPYERFMDMLSTVRLAVRLAGAGADVVQFTIYTPLPGTAIFRQALEEDTIFTLDWDRFDFLTPVMKTMVHPSVIQAIQYFALYSFYLRRYLATGGGRSGLAWPKSDLLPTAIRFILSDKSDYVRDALALPGELIHTALLYTSLSGSRPDEHARAEMLSESDAPIYAGRNQRQVRRQEAQAGSAASSSAASQLIADQKLAYIHH